MKPRVLVVASETSISEPPAARRARVGLVPEISDTMDRTAA